jgi:hypothetical protein
MLPPPPTIDSTSETRCGFREGLTMAEHNPVYIPAGTADTIQYKPLSLLAVAGFSVSVFFALLILAFAVDGLLRGQPFFLPALLILLPLAGAVLSGLGLWEVQNSEGTRAGAKLAKWGLALSLVVGISYYVYQNVTGLAIIQQANSFLMDKDVDSGFFPRLQGSEVDVRSAFLLTLAPNERSNVNPANKGEMERLDMPSPQATKGMVSRFLESYLVRVIRQAAPATVKIEPGTVKDWQYENGTYKINRTYRINTDDGSWDVPLFLISSEPEVAGDKRKWRVEWMQLMPLQAVSRTELGRKKLAFRRKAYEFLMNNSTGLFQNLVLRKGFDVYLTEQRPQDREELRARAKALHARTPLVAIAGTALPLLDSEQEENLRKAFLPGYQPLTKFADKVDTGDLRFVDPNDLNFIRASVADAFSLSKLPYLPWTVPDDELAPYEVKNGEVIIKWPFELSLIMNKPLPPNNEPKPVSIKVIGAVQVVASEQMDPGAPHADREWRVEHIEVVRAVPVIKTSVSGGPGG